MTERVPGMKYKIDIRDDPFSGEQMEPMFAPEDGHGHILVLESRPDKVYRHLSTGLKWEAAQAEIDRFEAELDKLLAPGGIYAPDHGYIGDVNTREIWSEADYIHGVNLNNIDPDSNFRPTAAQLRSYINNHVGYYEGVPDSEWFLDELGYRQWRFGAPTENPSAEDSELYFIDLDVETTAVSVLSFAPRYVRDIESDMDIAFGTFSDDFGVEVPGAMTRMVMAISRINAMYVANPFA